MDAPAAADPTTAADAALAGRLATDLDGSFEELVSGQADRLFSIALRVLGDRGDAEEAAQDALVRACDKWLFAGLSAHGAALHEK